LDDRTVGQICQFNGGQLRQWSVGTVPKAAPLKKILFDESFQILNGRGKSGIGVSEIVTCDKLKNIILNLKFDK
jgi:hypothetical protein